MIQLASVGAVLLVIARILERVVALHLLSRADLLGIAEAAHAHLRLVAPGRRVVHHGFACDLAQALDSVTVGQRMALVVVAKGVDKTFFCRQTRQKLQVGFGDLHAILAGLVGGGKVLLVGRDGLLVDHALEDLRYAALLEYPPRRTQPGSRQDRLDNGPIPCAPKARGLLRKPADQSVYVTHRRLAAPDREQRRLIQQAAKIHVRIVGGQLHVQHERLGQAFP